MNIIELNLNEIATIAGGKGPKKNGKKNKTNSVSSKQSAADGWSTRKTADLVFVGVLTLVSLYTFGDMFDTYKNFGYSLSDTVKSDFFNGLELFVGAVSASYVVSYIYDCMH